MVNTIVFFRVCLSGLLCEQCCAFCLHREGLRTAAPGGLVFCQLGFYNSISNIQNFYSLY